MDRILRKRIDSYKVQAELESKGATLLCLEEAIEQTTPGGKLSFAVLAAASEFELEIEQLELRAGWKLAKKPVF